VAAGLLSEMHATPGVLDSLSLWTEVPELSGHRKALSCTGRTERRQFSISLLLNCEGVVFPSSSFALKKMTFYCCVARPVTPP